MLIDNTKYQIKVTNSFKKQYKKVLKQGKSEEKFITVLKYIANGKELEPKYKNHKLTNDKKYYNCFECHLEPDWLLVYKIEEDQLILLLFAIGSHSDLFN